MVAWLDDQNSSSQYAVLRWISSASSPHSYSVAYCGVAREALGSVHATGSQALIEMRRLVGLLRENTELELAPQPGLARLDELVEQMRDAGLPVELTIEGDRRALTPGVDLPAYRIVQEALTNVLKHAGSARASVVVRFGVEEVELEVADDGRGAHDSVNGGHGLIGMRESRRPCARPAR